ncbi:putative Adaptin earbinding coat-associated protein 2 [Monocercomonoides exilis]|uniref:putative Adaptin earbinding coat-associated protein 2 n=1 Tax=Monocercomonoides exilis TaxID=2049356 RepID=UPI003559AD70|nr:putative Adaptin earbinding coat-associated protein 2 [Monocercomonoides exilis]|eukprot:MONOS_14154.1-p1 / transcript=MONOS_14154.1 / gene=MONOS_14154 / organism=Monocercomonoides_exilis_PA203 / gene_product=Adaptin earbinding coat-associated protein 2 / transcript_product=Adaptin earbinding coat-associated protein 2 / location=Mono_scaffold00948:1989-4052(+) / protein_length=393 / sequence_SO=supercontig / SO=protein_coding / is_pseudo=false
MTEIELTLTVVPECFVYRLGPRPSAAGYMCRDWKPEDHIWTGKVTVTAKGDLCNIRLEDPKTGEVFANCPVAETGPSAVERALDSSRYFIVRVDDGQGHHAFVGLGFETREYAFDFMHTISEHFRRLREDKEAAAHPISQVPVKDWSLKEGEKISVKLNLKPSSRQKSTEGATSSGGSDFLLPPEEDTAHVKKLHSTAAKPAQVSQPVQSTQSAQATAASFFNFTSTPAVSQAPAPAPSSAPVSTSSSNSTDFLSFFTTPSPSSSSSSPSPSPSMQQNIGAINSTSSSSSSTSATPGFFFSSSSPSPSPSSNSTAWTGFSSAPSQPMQSMQQTQFNQPFQTSPPSTVQSQPSPSPFAWPGMSGMSGSNAFGGSQVNTQTQQQASSDPLAGIKW